MNKTLSKTLVGVATVATLAITGCPKTSEIYKMKNEKGKELEVRVLTQDAPYHLCSEYKLMNEGDSAVQVINTDLRKKITYIKFANSNYYDVSDKKSRLYNVVDKIHVEEIRPHFRAKSEKVYNRGDEGTTILFLCADEDFKNKLDSIRSRETKALELELEKVKEISYK